MFFAVAAFAQDNSRGNFIEVQVTDTLMIKPAFIEYHVTINDGWAVYPPLSVRDTVVVENDGFDADAMRVESEKKLKELKDILTKKGYNPVSYINADLGAFGDGGNDGYMVKLKNLGQVQKLKAELKGFEYASIRQEKANSGNKALYEDKLLKKLAERAKAKAHAIATATGQEMVKIIQFTENPERAKNFDFNIHDTYFVASDNGLVTKNDVIYEVISTSATVRFETK